MLRIKTRRHNERGSTLVEFAIGVTVFAMVMFAVLEFGRALWVHNALTDAARRGARYATLNSESNAAQVKNVVVYGNPEGTGQPMLTNLSAANIDVAYSGFGLNDGTVSVSVTGYELQLLIPFVNASIAMPSYKTTLTAECAGFIPANV